MKKTLFLAVSMGLLLLQGVSLAKAPHHIGGFVLGSSVDDYKNMIKMETAMPVPYKEYLRDVQIKELDGFSSGHVCYGTCKSPGQIVQIKLKYSDASKKFYNAVLKQFRKRFGMPIELRGDPFHIYLAWKWSFTDTEKNRISMTLRHNTMDPRQEMSNWIELTMWNLIDEERCFYEKKHPKHLATDKKHRLGSKERSSIDWDRFIPRREALNLEIRGHSILEDALACFPILDFYFAGTIFSNGFRFNSLSFARLNTISLRPIPDDIYPFSLRALYFAQLKSCSLR